MDRDPVYAEWDVQQQKDTAAPAPVLDQLAFHGDVGACFCSLILQCWSEQHGDGQTTPFGWNSAMLQ